MIARFVYIGRIVDHHCLGVIARFVDIGGIVDHHCLEHLRLPRVTIRVPLLSTLGGSRIHFEDSRFNISLVTATSTRIQSEDV